MYGKSRSVYYSLQIPISYKLQKSSERLTIISDLYAVHSLLDKYIYELSHENLNIENTPLFDLTKKVKFDFFHTDTENYHNLRRSGEIPREDNNFILKKFKNKKFPIANTFTRGCIRISLVNHK